MAAGLACGVFNGFFVAYVGMPSFVVTLGMLSIARSLAVVLSGNQMLYQFGPDAPIVKAIGQAKWPLHAPAGWVPLLDAAIVLAFLGDGRAGARGRRLCSTSPPGRGISSPSAATKRQHA